MAMAATQIMVAAIVAAITTVAAKKENRPSKEVGLFFAFDFYLYGG